MTPAKSQNNILNLLPSVTISKSDGSISIKSKTPTIVKTNPDGVGVRTDMDPPPYNTGYGYKDSDVCKEFSQHEICL